MGSPKTSQMIVCDAEKQKCKNRIQWIDVAKFFGIFSIYLGHFGELAGKSYQFVFQFHVPLFFFISGCMENFNTEKNIYRYSIKKFQNIMVPYWLFCFISSIIRIVMENLEMSGIKEILIKIGQGTVRNSFFNGSLWFLTCLFVIEVLFQFIKLLRSRFLIVCAGLCMFMIAECVITPRPFAEPHWFYNVDSAFYYMIYYAIGFTVFPEVIKIFKMDTMGKKAGLLISGLLAFLYSCLLFEGIDLYIEVGGVKNIPIVRYVLPIFKAMTVIWFFLSISYLCKDIDFFNKIGRNTLYLCGSEYIVKSLMQNLLAIVGFGITIGSPLSAYLYVGILLYIANRYLVPAEKKILSKLGFLKSGV